MKFIKTKYLALLGLLFALAANARAALVAYDDATGAVSFTPGDLVGKVVLAIVAAVSAALAIGIISMGAGKTYTCVNFFMLDELRTHREESARGRH